MEQNPDQKTILVVEDESSNFMVVKATFKRSPIQLIWAKDGLEALEELKAHPEIDLILMDIKMPNMDGYEATSKIKSISPNLPIIALTAYAMAGEREKSLEAGCDDYMSKPIRPHNLLAKVAEYLDLD